MIKKALVVGILGASLVLAQPRGRGPRGGGADALKQALNLTDAQTEQIREITRQRMEAVRPIADQMREKSNALREEMKKQTPDQARIGQLSVELKDLREQLKSKRTSRGEAIQAVLTPEQREKLKSLEEAAKLGPAVRQAMALGLIEPEAAPGRGPMMDRPAMRMKSRPQGRVF